ncbi:ligand-dependent nuclear receptor-interacting factor 1 [Sceloporus undulatus]|uniref:ligand-dependent nuclear receptor-interacting factor 1 n=1 Tax=Sceloporus undulatus TaxID=8520 RepID=UPI001C4BBFB1|nr:ligand-dependent nuclear receptor-interacting factor 1 [Sceloporus undulatus]
MSQMAADAKGEAGTRPTAPAAPSASPRIAGRVYQLVPTTGLDGKNIMKLLPVSKPIRNFVSLHQSPVISNNTKGNVSVVGHSNLKDIVKTTISPFIKNPEVKKTAPGKLILPKLLSQVEKVDAPVVKENPTASIISSTMKKNPTVPTISSIQGSIQSADRSTLQNDATPVCLEKNNAGWVLVNANSLSVAPKSQVLVSGHPFQTSTYAEPKPVVASFLPPSTQQKILVAASSNVPGVREITKASAVIYVSPVNSVKSAACKPSQNIYQKPITKLSESLTLTVPQTTVSSSACHGATSDSTKKQTYPIKWIVQENPRSTASCVPKSSSNYMASEILKTFCNAKNLKSNPAIIAPTSSNNGSESQAENTSVKDNTLVMYNGNLYLLTIKEPNVVSENKYSNKILPTDETHIKRINSHLISPPANSTITKQVVNLVLIKNKVVACNAKDPKASETTRPQLLSEANKSLKVASTFLVQPQGNLQIGSTSQHEAISVLGNIPVGMTVDHKPVAIENANQTIRKIIFHKAAASTLLPSTTPDAFKEEEEKVEGIPGIQIKHGKEQDREQYLELRKKIGLLKEERVYLRRIPSSVTPARQETTVRSSNVQMSDSCDFSQRIPIEPELQEKEKIIEESEEELNIKRKTETPLVLENAKRKKIMANPDAEQNDLYSEMNNPDSPCRQLESQQDNSQSFLQCSQRVDLDSNLCTQSNEENSTLSPVLDCCENQTSHNEVSFREDIFSFSPANLEDTIKDEKITKLKLLLREQEAALEEIRKKMQQT